VYRALQSALQQSGDFEVVVIDDGSTPPVAIDLPKADRARVRVHRLNPNRGVSNARNVGAEISGGEILVFLDDDDEVTPGYLEAIETAFDEGGSSIAWAATATRYVLDEAGRETVLREETWADALTGPGRARERYLATPSTRLCFSGIAMRRSVFQASGGFNTELHSGEDREFMIRASAHGDAAAASMVGVVVHNHSGPKLNRLYSAKAEAYGRILEIHAQDFQQRPEALAAFAYKTAWLHYQIGDRLKARKYLRRALRARPYSVRNWALLTTYEGAGSYGPELHAGISRGIKAMKRALAR
jgi:glycosyltransferase involved in cell wall biosynthesis